MTCTDKFEEIYRKSPEGVAFCPYRICPIGAHSDHNLGKITGFAIDKGISIAYAPKQNGVIELASLQFDKRAQWHGRSVPEIKQMDWADYLRGVTSELGQRYMLNVGVSGVIEGSLPIGGLSSSAAVCIAFLKALCTVNGISLSPLEVVTISQAAENNYVGVSCGKLDQSCEVYSRAEHLLYLDCKDDAYELIPRNPAMKPFDIAIFFSGVERSLAGSAFNMRVDEARSAAYALKAFAGLPYGKFAETNLRDVAPQVYIENRDRLPETWRRRADHWFSEFARVEAGAAAWRRGDIAEYGRLSFESGRSSIDSWETGSPELKSLYETMTRTEGIYGGRFSGAGFKGCCMALVDPSFTETVMARVEEAYLKEFPDLRGRYKGVVCHTADGIRI